MTARFEQLSPKMLTTAYWSDTARPKESSISPPPSHSIRGSCLSSNVYKFNDQIQFRLTQNGTNVNNGLSVFHFKKLLEWLLYWTLDQDRALVINHRWRCASSMSSYKAVLYGSTVGRTILILSDPSIRSTFLNDFLEILDLLMLTIC